MADLSRRPSSRAASASHILVIRQTSTRQPSTLQATDAVYSKLSWRLLPVLCALVVLNYIDRTSLAFSSIQMTRELHFSPEVLGLGGGIFFVSYALMQVPCNVLCMRVGVRWWLTTIMLAWGCVACLFAATRTAAQFYALRLLLGLAEAGTFPAVWYAISLFFPPTRTTVPYALLNASVAISQVISAPLAAALLRLDGTGGLAGWQWVFLGEGLPSIALALALPWLLSNGPNDCNFISQADLQLLKADRVAALAQIKRDAAGGAAADVPDKDPGEVRVLRTHSSIGEAAAAAAAAVAAADGLVAEVVPTEPPSFRTTMRALLEVLQVWQITYLATAEMLKIGTVMALMLWLPVMVQSLLSGGDPTQLVSSSPPSSGGHGSAAADSTGTLPVLLTAIPFTAAACLTTVVAAMAQRTGNPLAYYFPFAFVGGASCMLFAWAVHHSRVAGFALLTVTMACGYAVAPHPLAAIGQLLAARATAEPEAGGSNGEDGAGDSGSQHTLAAALALPIYQTVSMMGGLFGPWLLGAAVERFGGFSAGTMAMGACMIAAGCMVLLLWCLQPQPVCAGCAGSTGDSGLPVRRTPPLLELPAVRRGSQGSFTRRSAGGLGLRTSGSKKSSSGGGAGSSRAGRQHRGTEGEQRDMHEAEQLLSPDGADAAAAADDDAHQPGSSSSSPTSRARAPRHHKL